MGVCDWGLGGGLCVLVGVDVGDDGVEVGDGGDGGGEGVGYLGGEEGVGGEGVLGKGEEGGEEEGDEDGGCDEVVFLRGEGIWCLLWGVSIVRYLCGDIMVC